jgi:hypothetical protein
VGFEHARFNAALIATIMLGEGAHLTIEFWCDQGHYREVAHILAASGISIAGLQHRCIDVRWPRNQWRRFAKEEVLCRSALHAAAARNTLVCTFASVSSTLLLALKRLLHRNQGPTVIAFPHSVLAGVEHPSKRLWNWPLGISAALRYPTPLPLRLVALSETIYSSVEEIFGLSGWYRLDHPYLFTRPSTASTETPPTRGPTKIGLFGALRTNLEQYSEVIERTLESSANVEFVLVGHISPNRSLPAGFRHLHNLSRTPISYAEFDRIARSVHYVLLIPDPEQHRWAVTCTLLDAFNYAKPGLFLSTPLLEEYRRRFGDFGYICKSVEELCWKIINVADEPPVAGYYAQQGVIVRARRAFDPATLALPFRALRSGAPTSS